MIETHAVPPAPDEAALRLGRLARLRAVMAQFDAAALVLTDPHNVRYATGARNMMPFLLRNPARYVFVPLEGPVVLFEFAGCEHMERGNPTIDEIRVATTVSYVASGPLCDDAARSWAGEIADLMRRHCPGERRIGLERIDVRAAGYLADQGFTILDAQAPAERARSIKTAEEIACSMRSMACVMRAEQALENAIRPGIAENALWAEFHRHVIANDGDYVETRLLSSGEKTNPWFQETGDRVIRAGDLVAHDTDVIGPHGYYADFSRTFLCGDERPTPAQRTLYRLAYEQIYHNMALIRPGRTFREITEAAWQVPGPYHARRYFVMIHGIGATGEYPYIVYQADYDAGQNYDGVVEPDMTLCVESFIGHEDGGEGVKLEQQVLVTPTGIEEMSTFPFDERLLGREV